MGDKKKLKYEEKKIKERNLEKSRYDIFEKIYQNKIQRLNLIFVWVIKGKFFNF